jgi:hypothetical protein
MKYKNKLRMYLSMLIGIFLTMFIIYMGNYHPMGTISVPDININLILGGVLIFFTVIMFSIWTYIVLGKTDRFKEGIENKN